MCYTMKQYDNRAKKLMDLEYAKRDIQKQIDAIEADIKADMGENQTVQTGNYRISWQVIVSNKFDPTAFKAEHEDLYREFQKQATTRRFTIKEVQ